MQDTQRRFDEVCTNSRSETKSRASAQKPLSAEALPQKPFLHTKSRLPIALSGQDAIVTDLGGGLLLLPFSRRPSPFPQRSFGVRWAWAARRTPPSRLRRPSSFPRALYGYDAATYSFKG
jgi:hypothetical protein